MNKNTNVMLQASLINAIKKTVENLTTVITDMYTLDPYNPAVNELEGIRDELTKYRTRLIEDHEKCYAEVKDEPSFIYNVINYNVINDDEEEEDKWLNIKYFLNHF